MTYKLEKEIWISIKMYAIGKDFESIGKLYLFCACDKNLAFNFL